MYLINITNSNASLNQEGLSANRTDTHSIIDRPLIGRVVHIMNQTMPKMLKMKVIGVPEVSRSLTMTSQTFREAPTRSYTSTSDKNSSNPFKF